MGFFVPIECGSDLSIDGCFSTIGAKTVDFNGAFLLLLDASSMDDFCDMAKALNTIQ